MSCYQRPKKYGECNDISNLEKKLSELKKQTHDLFMLMNTKEQRKEYYHKLSCIDERNKYLENYKTHCSKHDSDLQQEKENAQRRREEDIEQRKKERLAEKQLNELAEKLGLEEKQRELEARQREEEREEQRNTYDDEKLAQIIKEEEERKRNKTVIDEIGNIFTEARQNAVSIFKGVGNGLNSFLRWGGSSLRNRRQKKRISKKRNLRRK
jgi:hypothetical protein